MPPPDRSCWPERSQIDQFIKYLLYTCDLEGLVDFHLRWAVPVDREDAFQEAVTYFYGRAISGYIKPLWNFHFSEESARLLSGLAISYIRCTAASRLISRIRERSKSKVTGALVEVVSKECGYDRRQDRFWEVAQKHLTQEEYDLLKLYAEHSLHFSTAAEKLERDRRKVTRQLRAIFAKLARAEDDFLDDL